MNGVKADVTEVVVRSKAWQLKIVAGQCQWRARGLSLRHHNSDASWQSKYALIFVLFATQRKIHANSHPKYTGIQAMVC